MYDRLRAFIAEWRWWLLVVAAAGLVAAIWWLTRRLAEIEPTVLLGLWSQLTAIATLPLAIGALFVSLRFADWLGAVKWSALRKTVTSEPLPAAIYASTRWLAVAWVLFAVLR